MAGKQQLRKFSKNNSKKQTLQKRDLSQSDDLKKQIIKNKLKNTTLSTHNDSGLNDPQMLRNRSDIETRLGSESNLQSNTTLDVRTEQLDNVPQQQLWGEPDSDEDYEMLYEFDVEKAWKNLLSLPDCMKVSLSLEAQKKLELEIGKNITEEYPWKQIKFKDLIKLFDDDIEVENLKKGFQVENLGEFHSKFVDISINDLILVVYMPLMDYEENDYFVFYGSHESARRAGQIIENIEKYERWLLNKMLMKKTRYWVSKGSEYEVNLIESKERTQNAVDVEFESVYPIQRRVVKLSERHSNDVRDGYVELLPGDKKFDNIYRRRVDIGIQSSEKKISLEQQTNPTFPSNAWTQYKYDIDANEAGLDQTDDEDGEDKKKLKEDSKPPSKGITPTPNATPMQSTPLPPPPPPKLSKNVEYLLETIEFNQVDMYRNDYEFISSGKIEKNKISKLEEILSFAYIPKSLNRIVCAVDWYPTLSGMLVASYTFTNLVTSTSANENSNFVAATILEQNPVLMWSFSDSLKYKLEFEAPREVTALSFCPFDNNVLLGGTINGTIIIWDLQNRLEKLDKEEILTAKQLRYRTMMRNHLLWTKQFDDNTIVRPVAVSSLHACQNGPITEIKWLDRGYAISQTGQLRKTDPGNSKYFLTVSLDGTVAFWYIDSTIDAEQRNLSLKYKKMPRQLIQNISVYQKYDRLIKPIFMIESKEPITNILIDSANFHYEPVYNKSKYPMEIEKKNVHLENIEIKVNPILRDEVKQELHVSSLYGQTLSASWEGLSQTTTTVSKEKLLSAEGYARVHDGPIIAMERNKFIPKIFITAGGTIWAMWYEGYTSTPLLWRKIGSKITQIHFSSNRPAILYIATADGRFQMWDMLFCSGIPSFDELLGGGIISLVSEPILSFSKKVIAIGDYNSNLKIYDLPSNFYVPVKNEKQLAELLLEHAKNRKSIAAEWQKNWLEKNADIIEAIKSKEEEKQEEIDNLQKEIQELNASKLQMEDKEQKQRAEKQTKKKTKPLTEVLEKKWDEFNLKRIMDILMKRKHLDPVELEQKTALEKERLKYIKEKKDAIKRSYRLIDEDISEIRAKLLPIQKTDLKRIDLVNEFVINIINQIDYDNDEDEDNESYEMIENKCISYIEKHSSFTDLSFHDFFKNGEQRRGILNRHLSDNINYKRRENYENLKMNGKLSLCNFGKNQFSNLQLENIDSVSDETKIINEIKKDIDDNNKSQKIDTKLLKDKDVELSERHPIEKALKENE